MSGIAYVGRVLVFAGTDEDRVGGQIRELKQHDVSTQPEQIFCTQTFGMILRNVLH